MGGRGASSGISIKGKKYGTEYHTVREKDSNGKMHFLKTGNIKFILQNQSRLAKTPMETMTRGRVYVLVVKNKKQTKLKSINYYDTNLKRNRQIDLDHFHHAHIGYEHDENGTRRLTIKEKKLVAFIRKTWDNWIAKHGVG